MALIGLSGCRISRSLDQAAPLRGAGAGASAALCLGRPARRTPGHSRGARQIRMAPSAHAGGAALPAVRFAIGPGSHQPYAMSVRAGYRAPGRADMRLTGMPGPAVNK
jgi:hypothetical protein